MKKGKEKGKLTHFQKQKQILYNYYNNQLDSLKKKMPRY